MPAGYYRGLLIEANTSGNNKTLRIRDSDTDAIHEFTGPAGNNTINHAIQSQIEYTFTTPFVAHLVRDEPANDGVEWQKFGIKYLFDPWPELSTEVSAFLNLGTPGAKYVTSLVLPMDTGNNNCSLRLATSDNNWSGANNNSVLIGPFVTPANEKTPVAIAFTTPFVFHEVQFQPQNNGRFWYSEAKWNFEPWPERIRESSFWTNLGAPGPKYIRGVVIPIETGNNNATLTFTAPFTGNNNNQSFTSRTPTNVKVPTPFASTTPFIAESLQVNTANNCRIWWPEARWDFDLWPELITEATPWMDVLPGGAAAFLQGLLLPVEAAGGAISLTLKTDISPTPIALTAIRTPLPNVKTPIPYALATPVVCHQVQIIPSAPCRVWMGEIQWIAEATPELASTWTTQPTAHGMRGYQSVLRIEAAYTSTADVNLSIIAFDGVSPDALTLPSTGGVKKKLLLTPTFNKGQLFTYSGTSSAPFQMFLKEFLVWVSQWGRAGGATPYNLLGGAFDDKATI